MGKGSKGRAERSREAHRPFVVGFFPKIFIVYPEVTDRTAASDQSHRTSISGRAAVERAKASQLSSIVRTPCEKTIGRGEFRSAAGKLPAIKITPEDDRLESEHRRISEAAQPDSGRTQPAKIQPGLEFFFSIILTTSSSACQTGQPDRPSPKPDRVYPLALA